MPITLDSFQPLLIMTNHVLNSKKMVYTALLSISPVFIVLSISSSQFNMYIFNQLVKKEPDFLALVLLKKNRFLAYQYFLSQILYGNYHKIKDERIKKLLKRTKIFTLIQFALLIPMAALFIAAVILS